MFDRVSAMWFEYDCVKKIDQGLSSLHQHIIACTVPPPVPPTDARIISIFNSFGSHPCLDMHVGNIFYHIQHIAGTSFSVRTK